MCVFVFLLSTLVLLFLFSLSFFFFSLHCHWSKCWLSAITVFLWRTNEVKNIFISTFFFLLLFFCFSSSSFLWSVEMYEIVNSTWSHKWWWTTRIEVQLIELFSQIHYHIHEDPLQFCYIIFFLLFPDFLESFCLYLRKKVADLQLYFS